MLGKIWLSCNLKKPLESLHRDTDHFKHDNYEMMLTDVHYLTKKKKKKYKAFETNNVITAFICSLHRETNVNSTN